jgi:hypothetical protein
MTAAEKIQLKNKLKQFALSLIGERIAVSREAIDQAQQAANQEEKSSAGDKYETARAMNHLQKDMHARQLSENRKELAILHAVNSDIIYTEAVPGALIECAGIYFFIAAGLGKHMTEGRTVFFLSPNAPLAKQLQHKKTGDQFLFNKINTIIIDLY